MKNRLNRLKLLLERLRSGNDIQSRDLKSVLSDDEWSAFNEAWESEKSNRSLKPPKALEEYIRRKKDLALSNARYLRYVGRPASKRKQPTSSKLGNAADNKQSDLIEYLREIISDDPSLVIWLVHSEPHQNVDEMMDAGEAPLVCTSRTVKGGSQSPMGKLSKRELKIKFLEQVIATIEMPETDDQPELLKEMKVKKLKRDFSNFKI